MIEEKEDEYEYDNQNRREKKKEKHREVGKSEVHTHSPLWNSLFSLFSFNSFLLLLLHSSSISLVGIPLNSKDLNFKPPHNMSYAYLFKYIIIGDTGKFPPLILI